MLAAFAKLTSSHLAVRWLMRDLRRVSAVRQKWVLFVAREQRELLFTVCRRCLRWEEVKEACSSRTMPGGREVKRSLPGGRRHRERVTSGEMRLLSTLRWAWLTIASGYTFMTGKALRRFRVKPHASYWLKSNTMDEFQVYLHSKAVLCSQWDDNNNIIVTA